METDRLGQVLREADRVAGAAPPIAGDLAERVRQLARHRRRVRVLSGALAAGLALMMATLIATRLPPDRSVPPGTIVQQDDTSTIQRLLALQAEAQRLRDELINLNLQTVTENPADAVQPDGAAHRAVAHGPDTDIDQRLDEQLERAAYLFVYQAERYQRELNMPDSAIASYRQAVELFPRTRAAEKARIQLARFENEKGNSL